MPERDVTTGDGREPAATVRLRQGLIAATTAVSVGARTRAESEVL